MTEKELVDLKKRIDNAKIKVSELIGKQKYLKKQLQEICGTDQTKEAKKNLDILNTEIKKLDEDIENRTNDLKEKYDV